MSLTLKQNDYLHYFISLLFVGVLISTATPLIAHADTVACHVSGDNTTLYLDSIDGTRIYFYIDGVSGGYFNAGELPYFSTASDFGAGTLVLYGTQSNCNGLDEAACALVNSELSSVTSSGSSWSINSGQCTQDAGPPPPESGLNSIIDSASTSFSAVTGFYWDGVIDYMKSLLVLVAGTGLGVLQAMLPWIVALAFISAIIFFIRRAFVFFWH